MKKVESCSGTCYIYGQKPQRQQDYRYKESHNKSSKMGAMVGMNLKCEHKSLTIAECKHKT